jgi:hypothetical protein
VAIGAPAAEGTAAQHTPSTTVAPSGGSARACEG